MKSLVAYYSRTNITKKLAENIANQTNADIEEITPKVNYRGKIGYARGGKHAISEKIIDLEELKFNPQDYDMVYIGAPVWAGKIATPTLSYIKENEGKFKNVKLFMTAASNGFEKSFKQIEKYSIKPVKTLGIITKDVKNDNFDLNSFIE